MTLKQRYAKWQEFVKMIRASTDIIRDEDDDDRFKRVERLEAEPEQWFKYYFPRFAYAPSAGFHMAATERVINNPEWYEVRMWSRELAKSTRTMMEVLYLVFVGHPAEDQYEESENSAPDIHDDESPEYYEEDDDEDPDDDNASDGKNRPMHKLPQRLRSSRRRKRNVLLISNSLDNAERLLMPYRANLEFNNRIIQDYGEQKMPGFWDAAEFITQSGAAFRALGAGQSPRGTRNEEIRPDIILFDDIDTDADCLNPEIVAKKWRWIEEAAIGTRSISLPTTIIFCGNRIAPDCCVDRATNFADHVDEINIRDKLGRSSWPAKNREVDIDRVLSQKSYAAAQKEYFNNPIIEGSVFNKMAYKPVRHIREYEMLVCYTDPSYRFTGDYKATVLIGKTGPEFHIIKCFLAQATTAEMIGWHYRMMDIVGERACYYYMEEVFLQDVLVKEVSDAGKRSGRPIPIKGDRRQKPDKFMRIESLLEPLHRNGELYFNEAERNNPHMVRLIEQFTSFAPGSRAHDDGPDAVEGAIWIINQSLSMRATPTVHTSTPVVNHNRY